MTTPLLIEGLYLLRKAHFVNSNEPIYKIGRSSYLYGRMQQYDNGTIVYLMIECNNSEARERELINIFKNKFKFIKYHGNESFEGDIHIMKQTIIEHIQLFTVNTIKLIDMDIKLETVNKETNLRIPLDNQNLYTQAKLSTIPHNTIFTYSKQQITTTTTQAKSVDNTIVNTSVNKINTDNNVINNYNIPTNLIVPSGFEMLLNTIPPEDIKNYLLLGKDGIDKVFAMTFENNANINFFFPNSNKKNISYLSQNYTLDTCQENQMKSKLQDKYIQLIYGMYAKCANILQNQDKTQLFELIHEMNQTKTTSKKINTQILNLFDKLTRQNAKEIAKRIQSQIIMFNTNTEYKTAVIEYCTKYFDYVQYIENIYELDCKPKIPYYAFTSELDNSLD